jgi:penicillin-binding protein 1A
VRYEKGVIGLAQAIKYFFGDLKQHVLTAEESFFLVERLSNITSTVNWDRVKHLILRSSLKIDRDLLLIVYLDQVKAGRLKPDSNFPVLS